VSFYNSAVAREADGSRPITQDPAPGNGVLLDLVTTTTGEVIAAPPGGTYFSSEATASPPLRALVRNTGTASRCAALGAESMAMLSAAASPFCRPIAPEGAFCKPEEDPFLLLESSLKAIERIPQLQRGLPLRRTWIEQPYGEEEITLLEEEVIPTIQQCLARVDELDERLLAQQELLHRCQLEAER
jgi:hypothetical protein